MMQKFIRIFIDQILKVTGYTLINREYFDLVTKSDYFQKAARWTHPEVPLDLKEFVFHNIFQSHSQMQQDLLAQWIANKFNSDAHTSRQRYFVEFGAADGINLSNTYLLEQKLNWTGLLSEPAHVWKNSIIKSRSATLDTRCVYEKSGMQLEFAETSHGELSTISQFTNSDSHSKARSNSKRYMVTSVSLADLLGENRAPKLVDYLSIDTEGSEFMILSAFNFSEYQFNFISVEHNFTSSRALIFRLMQENGYSRILSKVSDCDDWYVPSSRMRELGF